MKQTIEHLNELMAAIQVSYYKGKETGLWVHEDKGASISIDLYNFEGDGKPVCNGLTFQRECDEEPIRAFCIAYNSDETTHLCIECCYDDGGLADGFDLLPEKVPEEVLAAIASWLESQMKQNKC